MGGLQTPELPAGESGERTMKIGIDARFLTHPQRGGFKTYTCSLISALAGNPPAADGNEYVLYTDRPAALEHPLPANFVVEPVAGRFPAREQVILPLRMRSDGIEVAHFPCNTAPLLYRGTMVVTIHDAIPIRRKDDGCLPLRRRLLQTYWRSVIPWSARKARLVIAVSNSAAGDLCAMLGLPADKIRVVHNGIAPMVPNSAGPVPPAEIQPGDRFLLAFAAADGRKNEERTMAAYRIVSPHFPGLRLVLVCADADTRTETGRLADAGVVTIGPVPAEQLAWLYKEARSLVFPSLDEGFGLPPLEAMAAGTPVIASRRGALPEVLGDAALFVDPEDELSIAGGIRVVLGDERLSNDLRTKGLARAELFTRERMAQETIRIYAEAAG